MTCIMCVYINIYLDQLNLNKLLSQQRDILQVATPVAQWDGATEIKNTVGGVMSWCENSVGGVSVVIGGANGTIGYNALFRVGGVSGVIVGGVMAQSS